MRESTKRNTQKGSVELAIGAFVLAIIGSVVGGGIACAKLTGIDPGNVGVSVKKCSGGGVNQTPIPTGYYWREIFCEDVIEYPTNLQTLILARTKDDGDTSITVTSSEGMPINVDVSLSFTLDAAKVPALYTKFRQDIDHLKHIFIRQTVREALQATFSKYTAEQLYSTKREIARAESQTFLTDKLSADGFMVVQFTLNETRVPDQVTQAINAKVAMSQEAQRSEQEVRKKEAEASQIIAAARGTAEARKLAADAEAYANLTVAKSVTPAYIHYISAQKWNGQLPQFAGQGPMPFVQVGKQ